MKKVKLALENLRVNTFAVEPEPAASAGTVQALQSGVRSECYTWCPTVCDPTPCTCPSWCPTCDLC